MPNDKPKQQKTPYRPTKPYRGKGHQRRGYQRRKAQNEKWEAVGQASETKARTILARLKDSGLVVKWKQSRRWSKDDKEGADFLVLYRNMWIPIQVKSSTKGCNVHNERSHKPAFWPGHETAEVWMMKILRRYVVLNTRHPLIVPFSDPTTQETKYMQIKLSMAEAYYMVDIFRSCIAGTRYETGNKEDVRAALDRLRNEGILWWEDDKADARKSGFVLSDAGYEFVRYLLTYCKEPKRFFVNQCNRYGPTNWKTVVEQLFDYQCTTKIPKHKIQLPDLDKMVFEKTSWGFDWKQTGG